MDWREEPTPFEEWTADLDNVLAIDENGTTNLKGLSDPTNKPLEWFTITGVMFSREEFIVARNQIVKLKTRHWPDGLFKGKRVVLHSRDIRKKTGPFNPRFINEQLLNQEITEILTTTNYKIFSSSINKYVHKRKYIYPYPIYDLCLEFVMERYNKELCRKGQSGAIVVESRGHKENKLLLEKAVELLTQGNRYNDPEDFRWIKGIYFNPKRTKNNMLSFPQLEIADLISYYIHDSIKKDEKTPGFLSIENKLSGYPEPIGKGIKIFPNSIYLGGIMD